MAFVSSKMNNRGWQDRKGAGEESPGFIGQDAGYRPVEETLRTVQQKYTATFVVRVEWQCKRLPPRW